MNGIFGAALELQRFGDVRGWRSCVIGGLAVLRWGEPRATQDADLVLLTGFGNEQGFAEELTLHFRARISDPVAFALRNRVLLLTASNGIALDVSFAGLPFEVTMLDRATPFDFGAGCVLTTCSAEDLLVLKAFADRPRDWVDITGIIERQPILDASYIVSQLSPLCDLKGSPEIVQRLRRMIGSS
jgi:hypothetical protein